MGSGGSTHTPTHTGDGGNAATTHSGLQPSQPPQKQAPKSPQRVTSASEAASQPPPLPQASSPSPQPSQLPLLPSQSFHIDVPLGCKTCADLEELKKTNALLVEENKLLREERRNFVEREAELLSRLQTRPSSNDGDSDAVQQLQRRVEQLEGETKTSQELEAMVTDFSANTQAALENERAELQSRAFVAEAQLEAMQQEMTESINKYLHEITSLQSRLKNCQCP